MLRALVDGGRAPGVFAADMMLRVCVWVVRLTMSLRGICGFSHRRGRRRG
jgi:hypothetical protein